MVYVVKSMTDFEQQLLDAGQKLVVVAYFATYCGPCKMITPKLIELGKVYADRVVVLMVDVDECKEVAMEYFITSTPTFVFIKHTQLIVDFRGTDASKLAAYVHKYA